ncbi:hypothetical protein [Candidatus Palauibacter sp.]|uniref:hypothetical protein n=1 Tax=Candidatus Palauibacter sp. TaxID=3101350 RepID=UPI003B0247D9
MILVVRVTPKPRVPEVLLASSAVRKWPLWILPKESPDIEVLYSAILMDKVPSAALAEANQQQSIPVELACLRTPAEQVF